MFAGSIGDLIDYSVDKIAEMRDKPSLSRLARNADYVGLGTLLLVPVGVRHLWIASWSPKFLSGA
jgi:hypothetical protein